MPRSRAAPLTAPEGDDQRVGRVNPTHRTHPVRLKVTSQRKLIFMGDPIDKDTIPIIISILTRRTIQERQTQGDLKPRRPCYAGYRCQTTCHCPSQNCGSSCRRGRKWRCKSPYQRGWSGSALSRGRHRCKQ